MPTATANGCSFYYELQGQGPDLVFIHGEDHGVEMFEHQVEHFANDFRCLVYYRRGHGRSELTRYGYSLHNQVQDLASLLEHLDIANPVLVAVAMATPLAVSYALESPGKVRGLALASWYELHGCPLMEERRKGKYATTFAQLHMQMHDIIRHGGPDALIEHMQREGDAFLPILPKAPEPRLCVMRMMSSHPPQHYIAAAEYYSSMPNLIPRVSEIRAPLLGICGDDDPCPDQPDLLNKYGVFQQKWIAGARRFSMIEQPQAFNAALRAFLASLPE